MVTNRFNISTKFENGDVPSQSDFVEIFNSFVHKDEDKANIQMVEAGIDNERYVTPALLNAGLKNIGIITGNCYMPHKETFESTFSGTTLPLEKNPIQYSVKVFKNGQLLQEGPDYTVNYNTAIITFSDEVTDRNLEINYWYKNFSSNPGNGGEAIDFTNFLHTTGNETKKGILTFNNATPTSTSGIVLTNSGVGTTATALDISVSGTGKGIALQNSSTGTGIKVSNTGTGTGLHLNSSSTSTGDPLKVTKDDIVKAKIDVDGNVTAKRFISSNGVATEFVKGDGSLDPTTYADNTKVIHNAGNEERDGALKLTHDSTPPEDVLTITKNNSANCLKLVQNSNSNATTSTFDTTTANVNRKAISIRKIDQENAFITHEGNVTATSFTSSTLRADITDGLLTIASSDSPTATQGQAKLYAKTDGTTDMYVMGSDGIEKKIGAGGGSDLSSYAKLDSPTFIGVPTAPTAAVGTNTSQIATTAFVKNQMESYVDLTTNQTIGGNKTFTGVTTLTAPAISGRESLLKGNITDNPVDMFQIANGTTTSGRFIPTFISYTEGGYQSMLFRGLGKSADDLSSSAPYIQFLAANTVNPADPNNGELYTPTKRDLFTWGSVIDYMKMKADGRVIIGDQTDDSTSRLVVSGAVKGNSFIKTGGTGSQYLMADGSVTTSISTSPEPTQITITSTVNITTDTVDANSKKQIGKNVIINNGASTINITVNGGVDFSASYLKHGTGAITFVQGAGRTLVVANGTAILNGAAGSTATISSIGTTDYLRISNV